MYEYIKGELADKGVNYAVIDASGVGYRIYTNSFSLAKLSGGQAKLYTYLHVREEEQTLYGFFTQEERNMFLKLLGVSGIGPKVALSVLSSLSANDIAVAIITGNAKAFSSVSGVGNKTAQRIILELKEKIENSEAVEALAGAAESKGDAASEAVNALCTLGYIRSEAVSAVSAVCKLGDTAEELILLALKRMDRG
jgi:Holliday junction DNA helicase RuvA